MATLVQFIVDPDAGAGYDYLSLQAAVLANQSDITLATGSDQKHEYLCRASAGSVDQLSGSELHFNNYTTDYDNDNFVVVKPIDSSQAQNGQWDASRYRFSLNGSATWHRIFLSSSVQFHNLQLEIASTAVNNQLFTVTSLPAGYGSLAYGCLCRDNGSAGEKNVIVLALGTVTCEVTLINNIFYGFDSALWYYYFGQATLQGALYNNTFILNAGGRGLDLSEAAERCLIYFKNNHVEGTGGYDYGNHSGGSSYHNNNSSGDTTSWDGASFQSFVNTYEDAANHNYRLVSGDDCIDAGADLSADAQYPFADDMLGADRPVPWDIGAFEYFSPGDALTASDIASSTANDTSTIGQTHNLLFLDLSSTVSFDTTSVGQIHGLTSVDISAATDLESPPLSEVNVLSSQEIAAGSSLDTPAVGQEHGLSSSEISSAAALDTAGIGQEHVLTSVEVAATSSLDTAGIGQEHVLSSSEISASSGLDAPAIDSINTEDELTSADIGAVSSLDTPAISQEHELTAAEMVAAATLDDPSVGQEHGLSATEVSSSSALDTPAAAESDHALYAGEVYSSASLDAPTIGQSHLLSTTDSHCLTVVDSAVFGQSHTLTAVSTDVWSTLDEPVASLYIFDLSSVDLSSAWDIDEPEVGQEHQLVVGGFSTLSTVELPSLRSLLPWIRTGLCEYSVVNVPQYYYIIDTKCSYEVSVQPNQTEVQV